MKKIPCYLILLVVSTACSVNSKNMSANVISWEAVEPRLLNQKIQLAYKSNLEWAAKPEHYAFNLFEMSDLKKITYEYNADNIESPKNVKITLVRDGFLDDSVRGDIQQLHLVKDNNGIWKILTMKKAISCWRRERLVFSSEACP